MSDEADPMPVALSLDGAIYSAERDLDQAEARALASAVYRHPEVQ